MPPLTPCTRGWPRLDGNERPAATYARELERLRRELVELCGLADRPGLEIVFAASGTDLHLFASALIGGSPERPLVCIDVEPEETGSGVPDALAGRHFSTRTALGEAVAAGAAVGAHATFVSVPARDETGALRSVADIEVELDAIVLDAAGVGPARAAHRHRRLQDRPDLAGAGRGAGAGAAAFPARWRCWSTPASSA